MINIKICGYVRLSKDDEKRNYVSIENQKLIIEQYAYTQNMTIDIWYEDDGISGYKFDRPGFNQMMSDLENSLEIVIAKDFSRIGRHNAKVLLLLEEFQERGKRLIVIDDNYDSYTPDDDVIGIKTWYNERYVKDTSKKIKSALSARQKAGTLMLGVPYGYSRNKKDKHIIEIIPKEAECVKKVYELYLQGNGYRKISSYLNELSVPTPSIAVRERELKDGKISRKQIATTWSDGMVKDMLGNDFYMGNYRLHKRARTTIHGKDHRVPKKDQYVFENHHSAIIDNLTFNLVQVEKAKRIRYNYRGSKENSNPFSTCLFCKDCGNRLTPIVRKKIASERKYYICSLYNTKGSKFCSKAHTIDKQDLMSDLINYIRLCRDTLHEMITTYDIKELETKRQTINDKTIYLTNTIEEHKKQLKILVAQKVKDLSSNPNNTELIINTYDSLQNDILSRIYSFKIQLNELDVSRLNMPLVQNKFQTPLEVIDSIINKNNLNRRDIETLVERIDVDTDGFPEIQLKYSLSEFIQFNPLVVLNHTENKVILTVMTLIRDCEQPFTSAKYLSNMLTDAGYQHSTKTVMPYIRLMIDKGYLIPSDNTLKPYNICISKEDMNKSILDYQCSMSNRWHATNDI